MKISLKKLSYIAIIACLLTVNVFALNDEDFFKAVKYFKEKNYPYFKRLARELIDDTSYNYQIGLMLAEVYFQEDNFDEAESILTKLVEQYPLKAKEIRIKLERLNKEKAFLQKSIRDRSRRFEVFFSDDSKIKDSRIIEEVFSILDEAQYNAGRFFKWYPDQIIKVMLYYGDDYKDYTLLPPWSGGGFDGKIRIALNKDIKNDRLKEIIFHEYAHLAIDGLTRGNCPLWFNEGVAQYFALKNMGSYLEKTLKPVAPQDFPKRWEGKQEKEIKELYNNALGTVLYLIRESNEYVIYDILSQLGEGKSFKEALNISLNYLGLNYNLLFSN